MPVEIVLASVFSACAGWAVPRLLNRSTVGTRYRTEKDCANCETRRAVGEIRSMVRELAIKAGVPVHEALKVGEALDKGGKP
ncbi:hypothetical protein [Desulfuromonas sp. TF]|uniref:hypothetical protein n=1 Tax=Desulfuromonas sp. TF TaxID=1232410 RepID=UPI0004007572|nr:hypothetical protein [Desulfuromonas sp. TF]